MKHGIVLFTLLLFGLFSRAQLKGATVQVSGLTCAMCSRTVQKALEQLPFVKDVKPNLKTLDYEVVFKEGAAINIEQFKKEVEGAGFSIAGLKLIGNFSNLSVAKNETVKINEISFRILNAEPVILNGQTVLTVVEKGFLTAKALKKYSANYQLNTANQGSPSASRVYQVML